MKAKIIAWTLALCMLAAAMPALASAGLSAQCDSNGIEVTWTPCQGSGTLTLYRNNWPILIECVNLSDGAFSAPACYAREAGSYGVRLKTEGGCYDCTVENCGETAQTPAPEATASPAPLPEITPEPTQAATPVPTAQPTPDATPAPTATPVPTATPISGSASASLADQVIAQTNQERQKNGLGALAADSELTRAACVRAQEIVRSFSHTRPDGTSWATVSASASGENIAMGYQTADKVMAAWMSSAGHRENILRERFTRIGVCAYTSGGVTYWVQLFGA